MAKYRVERVSLSDPNDRQFIFGYPDNQGVNGEDLAAYNDVVFETKYLEVAKAYARQMLEDYYKQQSYNVVEVA